MENDNRIKIKITNPTKGALTAVLFGASLFESVKGFGSSVQIKITLEGDIPYEKLSHSSKLKAFKIIRTTINSSNEVQCFQNIYYYSNLNINNTEQFPTFYLSMARGFKNEPPKDGIASSSVVKQYNLGENEYLSLVILANTTAELILDGKTERLVDKLSSGWICVSDDVPQSTYNTLMFRGGIPEPTMHVWYNPSTKEWFKIDGKRDAFIPSPDWCWLRYGHSDYPNNRF